MNKALLLLCVSLYACGSEEARELSPLVEQHLRIEIVNPIESPRPLDRNVDYRRRCSRRARCLYPWVALGSAASFLAAAILIPEESTECRNILLGTATVNLGAHVVGLFNLGN